MKLLIDSIETLQQYIRVNKSTDFGIYKTFISDAQDKYLVPFFGEELLDIIEATDPLYMQVCRALAPFSMALATDEFSINFGESGHTVSRSTSVAPASDAKIERAKVSLFERGWDNLDKALQYVELNSETYTSWKLGNTYRTKLFAGVREFQDNGMVDIGYSFLTFWHLRLLIQRIEKTETFMLLPADLRISYQTNDIPEQLKIAMQAYTGSRVAYLHTSVATRSQRANPGNSLSSKSEFKPVIRPLYEDMSDTGNYFDSQVEFWRSQINEALVSMDAIAPDASTLVWNSAEKRIFVPSAKRIIT